MLERFLVTTGAVVAGLLIHDQVKNGIVDKAVEKITVLMKKQKDTSTPMPHSENTVVEEHSEEKPSV